MRFHIGGHEFALQVSHRKRRVHYVEGYCNCTEDNKYVVFLDYDNVPLNRIIQEIERLQEDFTLGTFYVFASSKDSYHAVCLDKVTYAMLMTIFKNATIDQSYINVPNRWGQKVWTLRLTPKDESVVHMLTIPKRSIREQSTAHAQIIENLFGLKIMKFLEQPDNKDKVVLARYPV